MLRAFLKPGRAKPFWIGHPWVFSEAIRSIEGTPNPGDFVSLCDDQGREIGRGFFNPNSQLRIRLLSREDTEPNRAFWRQKLSAAQQLRRDVIGLPNQETNAYRLCNAEGDGLSGLTVDVYGDVATLQITSLGVAAHRETILDVLQELLSPRAMVEAASPAVQKLEGFVVQPGLRRGTLADGEKLRILENGLVYSIDPTGQKTGFFCDQRENRATIGRLAKGMRVLDMHSFVGGFALNACKGGAREVTLVDASSRAVTQAEENLRDNGFVAKAITSDAISFLKNCNERFDLVIVDPPKFAQRPKDHANALQGYRSLNALAMQRVEPDGLLCSCSCSGLVSEDEFLRALGEAAADAKRSLQLLSVTSAGPDHPIVLPCIESRYLKCVIARVR